MQPNLKTTVSKKSSKDAAKEAVVGSKIGLKDESVVAIRESDEDKNLSEEQLIKKYFPYATSLASKMSRSMPSGVDFDDILCNARLGLLEAAQRYDASVGVEFRTFAYYRIKGAIYDGMRKTGWIPRSLYSKIKFEQAANEYLDANARQSDSMCDFYKKELEEFHDSVNSVASIYVMSMDSIDNFEVEDTDANQKMEWRAEFQKIKEKVCDVVESLPDKERKLIKMYYFQNKTLEEIGEQLELSKSWTSRLHARALELLFKRVGGFSKESLA